MPKKTKRLWGNQKSHINKTHGKAIMKKDRKSITNQTKLETQHIF